MGLDENYKRAVIKLANVELPKMIASMDKHSQAMKELARQLNLMPRSVRMRP